MLSGSWFCVNTGTKIAMKSPLKYVQQAGILSELGAYVAQIGTRVLVVTSKGNLDRFGSQIKRALESGACQCVFAQFCGEVTKQEAHRVAELSSAKNCDVILGAGGGRVLDTARAAADEAGKRLVIFPTVAANDAPCSAVVVFHDDSGKVVKVREVRRNPDLVMVDTAIVAQAPVRFLAAGMGDALATWYEARACSRSGAMTHSGAPSGRAALALAKLCRDTLLDWGSEAMDAVERREINQALEDVVYATVYLSGMGFENGGVAASHAVNDGFTAIPDSRHLLHGELVGFGVLTQLELEHALGPEKNLIHDFMHQVSLPMTLRQLGLSGLSEEKLRCVAEAASSAPPMKNMPFPVSADDVYHAILAADAAGAEYLALH